jgi:large conductance mechanosensitive channel
MHRILDEFKAFALRGNVVDMAIGIIIGAAFGKIVNSAVTDVMLPPLGMLIGGVDFSNLEWVMKAAVLDKPAVTLKYGLFINNIISFVIVAAATFILVRMLMALQKKEQADPSLPPAPSKEEVLLTEIRDILKKK